MSAKPLHPAKPLDGDRAQLSPTKTISMAQIN